MSTEILDDLVRLKKNRVAIGITSICSAHPFVLRVAMERAARSGTAILVESTCNQVNQFGGYTGMTPEAFVIFVHDIAQQAGLPQERVLLGGDHLGPNVWQNEPAENAMAKSAEMVRAYVKAGYIKIHLDASMKLADDDPSRSLAVEIAAQRSAFLAGCAEQVYKERCMVPPRYVFGTEVPVPGGVQNKHEELYVTDPWDAQLTIDLSQSAFVQARLEAAWERVLALVVQPGVEFGDEFVHDYQPEAARELVKLIESYPNLVFEAHSTDYQTRQGLRNLVRDHFAILKVGPALTFAFREAVFALAHVENELIGSVSDSSNLIKTLDDVMVKAPEHWQKYYPGSDEMTHLARKYSLSDRSRYYWVNPDVQNALHKLFNNLCNKPLPLTLISQFFPLQYQKVRSGEIAPTPEAIISDRIGSVLEDYDQASRNEPFTPL
jgi:D-tagatose-1,6-bisphosphate aldolase subunit GatZ/KbaZ